MTSREDRIQAALLATIRQNPEGISIDDLWMLLSIDIDFLADKLTRHDMGPNLGELHRAGLVVGRFWHFRDGEKLIYTPAPSWWDEFVCFLQGCAPLPNSAYEEALALFTGGPCRRCGQMVYGEAFADAMELDFTPAFERGLRVLRV
jgi:hypothetical protein